MKKSYSNSWKSEKEKKVISTVEQVKKRKLYQQWKSEKKALAKQVRSDLGEVCFIMTKNTGSGQRKLSCVLAICQAYKNEPKNISIRCPTED